MIWFVILAVYLVGARYGALAAVRNDLRRVANGEGSSLFPGHTLFYKEQLFLWSVFWPLVLPFALLGEYGRRLHTREKQRLADEAERETEIERIIARERL